ncbi:Hypothetical predicted protein [Podarcis lilfordi]|uniref:Uncharacterized protein n=1 Tax=Podarcis lilfordi TaxID=74358 RepID=A0AA35KBS8_9SAUR|nr:Hypothetical predicted protein [Podarcis lilfordi]
MERGPWSSFQAESSVNALSSPTPVLPSKDIIGSLRPARVSSANHLKKIPEYTVTNLSAIGVTPVHG